MTPALPLRSGLPHKTSQTLLACLLAHKGFKNSQNKALQSNAFSLNSSFQKEWLQLGGTGLECMGNSTGSEQAGGKQVLRGNGRGWGKGEQDVQCFPKVLQTRPGVFTTRNLRATSTQGPGAQIGDLVPTQIPNLLHCSRVGAIGQCFPWLWLGGLELYFPWLWLWHELGRASNLVQNPE